MPGPFMAALAPAVVAGAASFIGGERANRASRQEAARNRAFQERMRGTAWQAAVDDMRAAGINPALAYGQGPAASPGGSMASQVDTVTPGVQSLMQMKQVRKQLEIMDEQKQFIRAQTVKEKWLGDQERVKERMANARWQFYFRPDGTPRKNLITLLQEQHRGDISSAQQLNINAALAGLRLPEQRAIAQLFETAGAGGKVGQMFGPMLISFIRSIMK